MSEDRLKIKPLSKNLLFRSKGGPKEKTVDRATLTQAILRVQTKLSASVKITTEVPREAGLLRHSKPLQQQILHQHQALPRIWAPPYPT